MKIIKYTDRNGHEFYNADYSPQLIGETIKRLDYRCSIELIEMTQEEYNAIPATNESAELWRL